MRPGAEEDAGTFNQWQTDCGPPSHSVPPHLVSKAAAALGREAEWAIREALFHAYFTENRDITDAATQLAIWREAGLDADAFESVHDPRWAEQVSDEHREAVESGVTGVPAIRLVGNDAIITGAHPRALYRRWIERTLERGVV
jgi:predicted DsbA family dithiol-disulfide isomerase